VEQDTIQVRNVEPQTAALSAAEEELVLSLGEFDHLDVVARAIHGGFWLLKVGRCRRFGQEPSLPQMRRAMRRLAGGDD
jgi:hypothetical protein